MAAWKTVRVFLRKMIEFEEKMLSPTAFIQSTHNTVGAQIALLLKCHHYNNTIVHRAFSFENALTEANDSAGRQHLSGTGWSY